MDGKNAPPPISLIFAFIRTMKGIIQLLLSKIRKITAKYEYRNMTFEVILKLSNLVRNFIIIFFVVGRGAGGLAQNN